MVRRPIRHDPDLPWRSAAGQALGWLESRPEPVTDDEKNKVIGAIDACLVGASCEVTEYLMAVRAAVVSGADEEEIAALRGDMRIPLIRAAEDRALEYAQERHPKAAPARWRAFAAAVAYGVTGSTGFGCCPTMFDHFLGMLLNAKEGEQFLTEEELRVAARKGAGDYLWREAVAVIERTAFGPVTPAIASCLDWAGTRGDDPRDIEEACRLLGRPVRDR
jgi:hypothetical protein